MTKARISKASPSLAGDNLTIVYSNELATSIAQGLQGVMVEAQELRAAFEAARGRQLPFMLNALAGVHPVSAEAWERVAPAGFKAWAIAQGCTFGDDGKPMKDGKVSAYAATSYSTVKIATIAITNGIAPLKAESLQGYVTRARAICVSRGLIADKRTGARTPDTAKGPKEAGPDKARASAARVVAKGDSALADMIAFATAPDHVTAFKSWVVKYQALLAAQAAL